MMKRKYYNNLFEHLTYKGFYRHPKFNYIWCNKQGDVFNEKLNIFSTGIGKGKYITTGIHSRHRLICETFLELPTTDNQVYIVNHINGIRGDDRLDNLEWVTYKQNSDHAYKTGLRSDNLVVYSKDIRTNEIVKHYSLQECARYFKVNGSFIHLYLKPSNYGKIYFGFYLLIREGQDWPNVDRSEIGKVKNGECKEVLVLNKTENKFYIFESANSACNYIKIQYDAFCKRIRTALSKNLIGYEDDQMFYCYLNNFDKTTLEDKDITRITKLKILKNRAPRKAIPITTFNLITEEVKKYSSSKDLAKELKVKKNTLQKHIYMNNGVWNKYLKITYDRK